MTTTTAGAPLESDEDDAKSSKSSTDDDSNADEALYDEMIGGVEGDYTLSPSDPTTNSAMGSAGENQRDEIKEVERMAQGETRILRIWRAVVGIIIMGAGALVSWGTYHYLDKQLEDETIDKFNLFVNSIEDASLVHFQGMVDSCRALSRAMTAQSNTYNRKFPFFTMDNWEVHASEARKLGGIEAFVFVPWLSGSDEIQEFNSYVGNHSLDWQLESIDVFKMYNPSHANHSFATSPSTVVYELLSRQPTTGGDMVLPMWTLSPPSASGYAIMLANMYPFFAKQINVAISTRALGLGEMNTETGQSLDNTVGLDAHNAYHTNLHNTTTVGNFSSSTQAHGLVVQPVFRHLSDTTIMFKTTTEDEANVNDTDPTNRNGIGGFLLGLFGFDAYLVNILPTGIRGITVLIKNDCGDEFTYNLNGHEATFLGTGDLSDSAYARLTREISFDNVIYPQKKFSNQFVTGNGGYCSYTYSVTPTDIYMQDNESNLPIIFTIVVAAIFAVMVAAFFIYDMQVDKRNKKMVNTAARSNAIVSSIFPSTIRDRLLAGPEQGMSGNPTGLFLQPTKTHLKSFLTNALSYTDAHGKVADDDDIIVLASKPIADLFTDTTVMFADISGFTAWSSVREPSQVFTLLETVYRAFDLIAKKRGVFKVETVGDCYVAVCGLPDPRRDHAVVMARFALDCLFRMQSLSKKLEVILGPDTGDLGMRIGLHSGPVTAGVLRGERSRFQLFGDTMNTASRMESTGDVNRVQVSEETAKLLAHAGKEHWLIPREKPVEAKGKGILSTYWLKRGGVASSLGNLVDQKNGSFQEDVSSSPLASAGLTEKTNRLIGWNVEVMFGLLKNIVFATRKNTQATNTEFRAEFEAKHARMVVDGHSTILDEVEEVIWLPRHHDGNAQENNTTSHADIDPVIADELLTYVTGIASIYNENPFHNFEHASHVTMSVVKLLSRIVAPSEVDYENSKSGERNDGNSTLHDHTYGITSDPLTQFACVLSALIHDADHPGIPNAQLVKEAQPLAQRYNGKSVAEQNSVELAWNLLMDDRFRNLRCAIYATEAELKRFRQLVVNSVMATDIVDKELKALRNARWEKAFKDVVEAPPADNSNIENVNRKATIVIEHLIQASDVAHTMQHWHIYRKWNERFFVECYQAYRDGRAEKNPAEFWYDGEIGFFDFYIIPLAKKLKDCGVFGVSSDEYLNYATKNRNEWEARGQEIVSDMVEQTKSLVASTIAGHGSTSSICD
ncbi:hypothetical protein ACA910_002795 [Epithemia clementina (nom. ined.)]